MKGANDHRAERNAKQRRVGSGLHHAIAMDCGESIMQVKTERQDVEQGDDSRDCDCAAELPPCTIPQQVESDADEEANAKRTSNGCKTRQKRSPVPTLPANGEERGEQQEYE